MRASVTAGHSLTSQPTPSAGAAIGPPTKARRGIWTRRCSPGAARARVCLTSHPTRFEASASATLQVRLTSYEMFTVARGF